jgi:hypothetical protein
MSAMDIERPATAMNRSPVAGWIGHGPYVEVGHVAHIDNAKSDVRWACHVAIKHRFDDGDGR